MVDIKMESGNAPILYLDGVSVTFDGFKALNGLSFYVEPGEMRAIIGPNGAGKTTMMDIINGKTRPDEGEVVFAGITDLTRLDETAIANLGIGRKFQKPSVFENHTVFENLELALKADRRAMALANLERVGLGDRADHLPMELSGGEQQRVAIARALACDPAILVGDEPTGNLDTDTAARVLGLLAELNREGTTVVYVTHDAELAAHAGRVVSVRDGVVVDAG